MRKDKVSVKNVRTMNVRTGEVKESRIQTTTPDERPNIWNLQAFVIVFLFIMLGTTINVYSVNNDNLTWVDSNGDFKLDSYNHSMINLDTDLVELNNLSLNDVFLDGNVLQNYDFSNGVSNWIVNYAYYSINDNILQLEGAGSITTVRIYQTHGQSLNDTLYNLVYVKSNSNDLPYVKIYDGYTTPIGTYIANLPKDEWYILSGIRTSSQLNRTYIDFIYSSALEAQNAISQIGYLGVYTINMSSLGIDNLTKDEMDYYYDLYVSLQENRIEAYKDLGNQPISQWQNLTQYLQLVIDAIMGPIDNISDWINKFLNGLFS